MGHTRRKPAEERCSETGLLQPESSGRGKQVHVLGQGQFKAGERTEKVRGRESVQEEHFLYQEERRVKANDREYNEKFQYASNCITTSKYNIITFLPVNLFEQFQEVANTYFLFLLILQLIPQVSSLSWFTTIVPLALVLSITAIKDATDDYFRHKSDNQVNNRQSQVLIHGSIQKEKWMNVRVGDIIKLENNQFVAADLLLLSSSEPHGLCYIETAELDGETNMKVRQSVSVTCELGDTNNLATFNGEVVCEPPNNKLDRFCGTLYWKDKKYPLTNQNVLLRGCVLRNTEFCYGLVIFAGPDTKLMQNSGRTKFKRTSIDRLMNTLVLWIFCFLVCMGVILAVGNAVWEREVGSLFQRYLPWDPPVDSFLFSAFLSFWSYVIILNTVVPISLYVSVEVIRLGHSYFINWDRQMFCYLCNTAAEARTTTLNEELGQVEYIFSDKTGTLTQNIMTFNKCSINGQTYGELVYKAQSPDEAALVTAARNFGFVFRSRTPGTISTIEMGRPVTYALLAILDFNNIRKRMSVIVRSPEGRIRLYCKGADTMLLERLHRVTSEYAADGLRTLALAYRDLSEEQWEAWSESQRSARKPPTLLGATAIEDKLQEGVPETIAVLSLANIKVWVLTGDKQETAVNIGYSCKMLTDDMAEVFIISGNTVQCVRQELRAARQRMVELSQSRDEGKEIFAEACFLTTDSRGSGNVDGTEAEKQEQLPNSPMGPAPPLNLVENISGEFGLVINGHSLAHALEADMETEFVSTACACKAVICCRMTPLQKAQVVELIKKHKRAVTLAVGDGANDISMIKSAHIGVGISGQEGNQAVLASDYSFSQFRFLQRLLLVHGRWSYLRMCRFLCYFFYKNFAFTMVHFWLGFFCGFSAQTVYDQYFITLYNIVYTSLPVLAMGIFDQDVPDERSLEFPKLYEPGQLNLLFNKKEFFICIAQGIYTSVVLFFVPYAVLSDATQSSGEPLADYQTFAVTTATALVIVVSVQIALDTGYWTIINHMCIWGSLGLYFSIMFALHSQTLFKIFPKQFHFVGSAQSTLLQPVVWLTIALATAICIVPVLTFRFLKLDLRPQLSDTVRYTQLVRQKKRKLAGRGAAGHWRGASTMSEGRLGARSGSRRSGYAFAHQEGFGELITSGKNMRLSSLMLGSFGSKHSSSWIDTLRRKKHPHTPPSTSGDCSPAPSSISASAPPLSNSSSMMGGSQDTPIDEETGAATSATLSTETNGAPLLYLTAQRPPQPQRGATQTPLQDGPSAWELCRSPVWMEELCILHQ
ncbi:hypothetical protein WMY93_026431 [Mugilogobius chulae]|uniref:Phospholipid-transporting ATPase n=1 Tax=Mugilogobius chulae TaxID=88201 RepID=A0AAW0N365_9GOBI